ncbi:MAG: hypothetical protein H8E26_08520 [FCB group bacterium]|nr:hypothetical protein [FCB group bacterium]MBL7028427.1 hypothetical protein [Candidatus Neomarinimicrobiota bacterium]MBL7122341.1 hypothetical protein [Candidatus Neomarinimicrobiota bacterium]
MMKRYSILMVLILGLLLVMGCEDDSDNDINGNEVDVWVGNWLSAGDNVAVILSTYFLYDSVKVELTEDNTVTLETHVIDGAWTTLEGTYVLTESSDSDLDIIQLIYTAFEQEGIIEIDGNTMRLEAVQTVPDIAATVPTPAAGFGADPTLGTINIQTYIRQD